MNKTSRKHRISFVNFFQSTQTKDKVNGSVQLNGGSIEELGQRMFGIDDNVSIFLLYHLPLMEH